MTHEEEIESLRAVIKELAEAFGNNENRLTKFGLTTIGCGCCSYTTVYTEAVEQEIKYADQKYQQPDFSAKTILTCFQILQGE